jgi:hypothetical protein
MPRQDAHQLQKEFPELYEQLASQSQKLDALTRRLGAPNCTLSEVAVVCNTETGVRFLGENFERRSLFIMNHSGATIYVHIRALNSNNATRWMEINNGGYWEPLIPPTNEIWIIGTTGNQEVIGYEGV